MRFFFEFCSKLPEGFRPESNIHMFLKYFAYYAFSLRFRNKIGFTYCINGLQKKTKEVEKIVYFDNKYVYDVYFEDVTISGKGNGLKLAIEILNEHKTGWEKINASRENGVIIFEWNVDDFKKQYKTATGKKFECPDFLTKETLERYARKVLCEVENVQWLIDEIAY